MKTSTAVKLRYAQKFLKAAHEAMVEAIAADPEFAAFATAEPNDSKVTALITALVEVNSAGKQLEAFIERHD